MTTAVPEINALDETRQDHKDRRITDGPGLASPFPCPRCRGLCNVEHSVLQDTRRRTEKIQKLYCERCEIGLDILWVWDGHGWRADSVIYCKSDCLNAFRRQLEALLCA